MGQRCNQGMLHALYSKHANYQLPLSVPLFLFLFLFLLLGYLEPNRTKPIKLNIRS